MGRGRERKGREGEGRMRKKMEGGNECSRDREIKERYEEATEGGCYNCHLTGPGKMYHCYLKFSKNIKNDRNGKMLS